MRARTSNRPNFRERGYTPAWDKLARAYRREHPLCEDCQEQGRTVPAAEVHHIQPVQAGGAVLAMPDKLRSLCKQCHRRRTIAEQGGRVISGCDASGWPTSSVHPWADRKAPSPLDLPPPAVPVTLVCGAPGSGKSSYVRAYAAPFDAVIDLDDILHGLSGMPGHDTPRCYLGAALAERQQLLAALATRQVGQAWVVMTLPDPLDRAEWRAALGFARVLMLATPQHECLRRIRTARAASPRLRDMLEACRRWFERYRPAPFDERVSTPAPPQPLSDSQAGASV